MWYYKYRFLYERGKLNGNKSKNRIIYLNNNVTSADIKHENKKTYKKYDFCY